MAITRMGKISAVLVAAMLISACGANIHGQQEKIAVVNWDKAQAEHPQYTKLEKGEKILKDLLLKRKGQEQLAKVQMGSLQKLRNLRQLSQQGYLQAEFNTKMVEQRERENVKLRKFVDTVEAEAEAKVAVRRKSVEDSYQLQLFNLRAVLASVKMKPEEKAKLQEELQQVQQKRAVEMQAVNMEKQAYIDAKVKPYVAEMQQHLAEAAQEYHADIAQQLNAREGKDRKLLEEASPALNNALSIMDKEIDKQQEKNDKLRKKINNDIESSAIKLAHERGYTIVFNKYKVNLKADDITDAVVQELKK